MKKAIRTLGILLGIILFVLLYLTIGGGLKTVSKEKLSEKTLSNCMEKAEKEKDEAYKQLWWSHCREEDVTACVLSKDKELAWYANYVDQRTGCIIQYNRRD